MPSLAPLKLGGPVSTGASGQHARIFPGHKCRLNSFGGISRLAGPEEKPSHLRVAGLLFGDGILPTPNLRGGAFLMVGREPHCACGVTPKDGGFLRGPSMTTTHTFHYRGYEIVAQRQWASWCASIYATRADLPLMSRSTLRTLAPGKEAAVAEAIHSIDEVLARNDWLGS